MEVGRDCVSGFCVDCECVYIRGTGKTEEIRGGGGGTVLKNGIVVHTWMTQHICSFFLNHQIFYLDTTIVCCGLCLK